MIYWVRSEHGIIQNYVKNLFFKKYTNSSQKRLEIEVPRKMPKTARKHLTILRRSDTQCRKPSIKATPVIKEPLKVFLVHGHPVRSSNETASHENENSIIWMVFSLWCIMDGLWVEFSDYPSQEILPHATHGLLCPGFPPIQKQVDHTLDHKG